jgi:uncharacterized protein YneF (UPF0154 family)
MNLTLLDVIVLSTIGLIGGQLQSIWIVRKLRKDKARKSPE